MSAIIFGKDEICSVDSLNQSARGKEENVQEMGEQLLSLWEFELDDLRTLEINWQGR